MQEKDKNYSTLEANIENWRGKLAFLLTSSGFEESELPEDLEEMSTSEIVKLIESKSSEESSES